MISTGLNEGKITPPSTKDIVEWSWSSTQDLPAQMVRNAWQHGLHSYFPPPLDHVAAAVVANNTNVNEEEESTNGSKSSYTDKSTNNNKSSNDDNHKVGQSEPLLSPACHGKDKNKKEEYVGSGDDDDEVGQSEPLLSPIYHGDKSANDDVDYANDNVDNANDNVDNANGNVDNDSVDNAVAGTVNDENNDDDDDDDDLPPALPDTIDLACILQQIQEEHANRS